MEWSREALLQSPLFAPLHPVIAMLKADSFPSLRDCNVLLEEHFPTIAVQNGTPLRFVESDGGRLPFEAQYEPRCYLRGEVQVRERNWHDLLNALVWLTFPGAKAAINARHYAALTGGDNGAGSQRGAVRDMNTLFDESGVIVACADSELAALLRSFRWKELFWQQRERIEHSMGFYLFGHGLYEKALDPYTGLAGQGLMLAVAPEFFAWPPAQQRAHLDILLTAYLNDPLHCRSTRELDPVPLLGVPGWSANNERGTYYDNADYFRSGRRGKP